MELAHIYPIKNQNLYRTESFVMILSHLLKYYKKENFSENQYIIMDNGLYEGSQSSLYLEDLIEMAEDSGIPVSEIVIPDTFFDKDKTIGLFEFNLKTLKRYSGKYNFMFVAQTKNIKELEEIIDYINQYADYLTLTVGIPKRAPFGRESNEALRIYKKCLYPIHFLGLPESTPLKNLRKVKNIVRSCDTSQICTMIKNHGKDIKTYTRVEGSLPIDLEKDFLEEDEIIKVRRQLEDFI